MPRLLCAPKPSDARPPFGFLVGFLALLLLVSPLSSLQTRGQAIPPAVLPAAQPAPSPSSSEVTNPLIPWRQLAWDDFRIDDVQKGLSAETVSYLRFRYKTHTEETKDALGAPVMTATVNAITFMGGFDKARSWRRSTVNNAAKNGMLLLHHEQGHLDLNEIGRRQLQALPVAGFPVGRGASMAEATADLSQRLGQWFRGEMFVLRARQLQYDKETQFGTNRGKQNQWSQRIAQELAATGAVTMTAQRSPQSPQSFGYRRGYRKQGGHMGKRFRFCKVRP